MQDAFLKEAEHSRRFELEAARDKWLAVSKDLGIAGLDNEAWQAVTKKDRKTHEYKPTGVYLVEVKPKTHKGEAVKGADGQDARDLFVLMQTRQKEPRPLDELMFPDEVSFGIIISEQINGEAGDHVTDANICNTGILERLVSISEKENLADFEMKTVTIPVIKDGKDTGDFRRVRVSRYKDGFKDCSPVPLVGEKKVGDGSVVVTVHPLWTEAMNNLFDPEAGKLSDSRLRTANKYLETMTAMKDNQQMVNAVNAAATVLSRCKPQ